MNKQGGNRVYLPLTLTSCILFLSNTKLSSYTVNTINYIHKRVLYNKSKLSISRFYSVQLSSEHRIVFVLCVLLSSYTYLLYYVCIAVLL
jgi:hypothetical protein